MSDLPKVVEEFVTLFDQNGVEYALMGGIAVRVYGIPRPTYDVDFTAAIPRDKLPQFYELVEKAGYTVPEAYRSGWVDQVAGMPVVKFRLYLEGQGVDVDLFLAETLYQQELLRRRRREEIDGVTAWLVSPEDLILLKLVAGRPRDRADIGDVRFVQGELDETYMRQWAVELGVAVALEQLLADPSL